MPSDTDDTINGVEDPKDGGRRTASKPGGLAFPYVNLEDAVSVAKAIYDAGSVPLGRDQIAARMHANPDSSSFAIKVSAAQMFGLIGKADRGLQITEVGSSILSPDAAEAQSARVSAFLTVELYKKLVDHFRGRLLPGRDGIESAMVNFGVAPKQKDRARQAFEKSASYAGYLNLTKDRLVPPILTPPQAHPASSQLVVVPEVTAPSPDLQPMGRVVRIDDPSEEKLIRGMLDRLPPLGEPWPIADRARWLRRLAHNLAMVYAPDEDAEIEVKVVGERG